MTRNTFAHAGVITLACLIHANHTFAQETRASSVADERAAKAETSSSTATPQSGLMTRFSWAANKLDGMSGSSSANGFYPDFSTLIPGSGWLAGGIGYRHHVFGDDAIVSASAAFSVRHYTALRSVITWPRLVSDRVAIDASITYRDAPEINYFGIGADTAKAAQTDYRLQSVDAAGSATVRVRDWLAVGGTAGYLRGTGVKPGLSSIYPSTTTRFDDVSAPGLSVRPDYVHSEVFIEADSRDVPGYPTDGGIYHVGFANFHDMDSGHWTFNRVDMDAAQYVPFAHQNSIIALRGRVTLSQAANGNDVPFFLLPSLGGANTLRGYADYRFRDRNAADFSAEYRWPLVFRALDGAVFADAGTVAPTATGLWSGSLHRDYGIGLRLHTASRSIARIDIAKGSEGVRVVATLSAALGSSRRTVLPYVP